MANQLNFKEYDNFVSICSNTALKKNLQELRFILYDVGQSANQPLPSTILSEDEHILAYVKALKNGYLFLYTNPYTIKAFESFNQALSIAKTKDSKELIKMALKALLELYDFELVLSNSEHKDYLLEYKNYCKTSEDFYWYELYKLKQSFHFISDVKFNLELLKDFENLMQSFPKQHEFWLIYLSYKAIIIELIDNKNRAKDIYLSTLKSNKSKPYTKYIKFRLFYRLMKLSSDKKEFQKAQNYIDSMTLYQDKADSIRSKYYLNTYKSDLAYSKKEFKKAYDFQKVARSYRIRMDYNINTLRIAQANVKYQTAEKEKQNLILISEKKRNQNIAVGLGGFLVLGSIIALLIYRSTKRKQRIAEQERELEIQKTTQILKEKEVETINAMVEGQEKERLRLAGELHDNLGSTLATVKMQVENLERNLEKVDDPKTLLSKTNTLINEAYQKVRSISHERNSGVMAKEGLLPAVQKLAKQISSSGSLQIDVQDFGLENRLSNHLEITIFRIIQELTTNIVKHAQATEASISLTQHDNELNIIVEDNGKGFKVGKLETKNGMGLGSIERRVEHLEGSMEVDSIPGKGTSIIIDIPL